MNEDMTNFVDEDGEDAAVITITYEDGTDEDCIVLDIFTVEKYGEQEYVALLSLPDDIEEAEDDELESEIFIFRYKEEDGEITLDPIEDEQEIADVQAAFEATLDEDEEE